jgi:hypothetical protein
VLLSYDKFRVYGFGVIIEAHKNGEYEVYWLEDSRVDLETGFDIVPAYLTNERQ